MADKKKTVKPQRIAKFVRKHRKVVTFNDSELEVMNAFCKKYKIANQAKFIREAVISTILRKTEEDHPTLF
ncbi:MAG: hypothetical protein LBG19_04995 [Prevotellaceae bacterium]|jgi:hypothetical protein|nr:hypothetical protein [Prevotellaceae bacterium]